MGEDFLKEAVNEDEEYSTDYSPEEEGYINEDDAAPEGLGSDEIDWDSNDIEER